MMIKACRILTVVALIHSVVVVEPEVVSTKAKHKNQRIQYPELKRDESVIDDYYGVKVADPYRYLEDTNSEEVKQFIAAQNALTDEYLSGNIKKQIEKRITEVFNCPKYGVPTRIGSQYYISMNSGLQNQDVYYVQDSLYGEPRVFFDPNTLSADGTIYLSDLTFSDDAELVSLSLNNEGSDWLSIRIRNVSTGKDFPETLNDIKFSSVAWSEDGLGIFYARYPKLENKTTSLGTETTKNVNQKLYYHRVGTNQSEDVVVLEFEDPLLLVGYFEVTDNGKYIIVFPENGGGFMVYFASLDEQIRTGGIREKLKFTPIVDKLENKYYYITSKGSVVYLLTNDAAPNYKIIGVDLNNPEKMHWTTIVAEHKTHVLESASSGYKDKLVLQYLVNVTSQLEVRSLTNESFIQRIDIPSGSVFSLSGDKFQNDFFFGFESFLVPVIIYRVDFRKSPYKAEIFKKVNVPGFEPSKFVTKQIFYPSYDGTLIPMFITHKKDLILNRNASAIIYGYGGFDISTIPYFSASRTVFMQNFDGLYAIPNIRGGGEYGRKWYEAGNLLNQQNSFNDFQAAAEYLIKEGYTTASKVAINGASNGGLLVAACVNQRPDLYTAAVAQFGIHDLLRFQKFTIGSSFCAEYGCSDDGNQTIFENLYRLSPLHNVRLPFNESVQYPAMLITTADHDDRVVPLHSFKLIAELQYKIGRSSKQTNPLLIRIQSKVGHADGKPTLKRIAGVAEFYTFLVESAGFVFTP